MSWSALMANPKTAAVKKMMYDFLQERYPRNDQIIERLTTALQTEADVQAFIRLVMDCYENGYTRAVDDHREQLKKAGLTVKIVGKS